MICLVCSDIGIITHFSVYIILIRRSLVLTAHFDFVDVACAGNSCPVDFVLWFTQQIVFLELQH